MLFRIQDYLSVPLVIKAKRQAITNNVPGYGNPGPGQQPQIQTPDFAGHLIAYFT